MNILDHFEIKRSGALKEMTQIRTMLRDFDETVRRLESEIATEEERAGVSDLSDASYPILARVLAVRRENLAATVAVLEGRIAKLGQIFPEGAKSAA